MKYTNSSNNNVSSNMEHLRHDAKWTDEKATQQIFIITIRNSAAIFHLHHSLTSTSCYINYFEYQTVQPQHVAFAAFGPRACMLPFALQSNRLPKTRDVGRAAGGRVVQGQRRQRHWSTMKSRRVVTFNVPCSS